MYESSLMVGYCPLISSLRGLARLSGALQGELVVHNMDKLTTLDGLDGISSIGKGSDGTSIVLGSNPNLTSATALSNANNGTFTSYALDIVDNPALACVPEHWPANDGNDPTHTIRNGKALHDPCLYSCDSATRTCHQAATGIANESACASTCH